MAQVVFNHEKSTMATTSNRGFTLFNCPPFGPFKATRSEASLGGVSLVALLYNTPLVAVVPTARNRTSMQLYDLQKHEVITEIQFDTSVINILINSKRVVVILEGHTHVFDLNTMECLTQLKTQNPPNRTGIGALSDLNQEIQGAWFAYPQCAKSTDAMANKGDITVLNCQDYHNMAVIPAHKTAISCLTFSNDGTMLASCSDKGTVIRVWDPHSCSLLFACRRGTSPATLWSLAFSPGGQRLAVTGSSGTLHCFLIPQPGSVVASEIRSDIKQKGLRETRTVVTMSEDLTILLVVTLPTGGGAAGGGGGGSSHQASDARSNHFGGASGTSMVGGGGSGGGNAGSSSGGESGGFIVSIFSMEQKESKQEGFSLVKEVALGLM